MFIGVSRSHQWRLSEPPEPSDDKDFQLKRVEFLSDVDYRCTDCHFRSEKYQHVHHKDGNHKHNEIINFECKCPLCHMCEHLGFVADNKLATLVFCPSLTQEELNAYVRISWVANYLAKIQGPEKCGTTLLRIARDTGLWIELLSATAQQVSQVYKITNIRALAEDFRAMDDKEYSERQLKYPHLRLLFTPDPFSREIEEWSRNQDFFSDFYDPNNWPEIVNNHISSLEG
ncbi:HNH endonuclease [Vibrio parahaemolyticus]|uniref:HNH endonuclease n=5 Tax=Vibrio TaxID=662 RepID=A0AA47JN01_VIBPH|nr:MULTISPECIES: HNH endonuclease [Vibrio]EJG1066068.1 HNH endonuclease [Vibrio parahaemolyticus O1]MDW1808646.1 HNH endonuclease [Vibrio sp. Vb2362]MDW2297923.1 HNH endonuclease [Vibrio sp. 1404]OOH98255.1 hypothetical protein BIW16_19325 [Vibrio sp. OULL4]ARR10330.1 hypothetical protein Vc3S01_p20215 [Vibrio campbellii]